MKIRCTVCGAPNETAAGFDTAYCLTCGSQIPVKDALEYRLSKNVLTFLTQNELVALAKEAHIARKATDEILWLLEAAAPSGDVEINFQTGLHYFNERDYDKALPYLFVSAEKMYPDGQCLYAVAKYLQNPDNTEEYPKIRKYLTTAQETCSKVYKKIDGDKLLSFLNAALDTPATPPDTPALTDIEKIN